jgi:hypothetical protein
MCVDADVLALHHTTGRGRLDCAEPVVQRQLRILVQFSVVQRLEDFLVV